MAAERRHRRSDRGGPVESRHRRRHPDAAGSCVLERHHAAFRFRHHSAAAPVSCRHRREPRPARGANRLVALPHLSRPDQPLRGAARDRGSQDVSGRRHRPRSYGAGAAARCRRSRRRAADDDRRPVRRHRHGGAGQPRPRHHDLERPRDAAPVAAARRQDAGSRGGHRRSGALDPPHRDRGRPRPGLCLRARRRAGGAGVDRPSVVRRGRADRPGLSRRPFLAARHGARARSPA